jgi:hypothetical protein
LTADGAIARVATSQEGRIASRQLHAIGVSTDEIDYRCRVERLHRVAYGIYAVGSPHSSLNARRWETVLAAGPGAVLSHGAAAERWGIVHNSQRLEVIAPRRVRRKGIVAHQVVLPADEMTTCHGIPVTTVNRTLLDLAARWKPGPVVRALNQAEADQLWEFHSLVDLVERHPRHDGVATIRAILADRDPAITYSRWEDELHDWILERFPPPLVNPWLDIGGRDLQPDFAYVDERVALEADSRYHRTDDQIDADNERDAHLQLHGWAIVRVTKRRLLRAPAGVEREVRGLLARRRVLSAH